MSTPPRILVLFGNVPLYGQERGNIEALDALRGTGCEVLFLIREEWTKDTIQAELSRRGLKFVFVPYYDTVRHGMPLRVWRNNLKGIIGGSWQLLRLIRYFKATHIHVGSTANVLNFLPALLLTRLPLIFRAGDVPPQHHWLWRMVWRYVRRRIDYCVCISKFVQRQLVSLGMEQGKSTIIYSLPPTRHAVNERPTRQESTTGLTFLYIGQITKEKGVAELINAATAHCGKYPDSRFLLAGDCEWKNPFAARLIHETAEAGLSDSIHFLGYVADIKSLLDITDVHICPSVWQEPLSNVVIEAKQAGVPSIVFPSGGLPELVTHGVDGYVCKQTTGEALAEAFESYEQYPSQAKSQGEAARESLGRFGLDRFAENWRGVYERMRAPRILVLFGNVPLYGQEPGDIEALAALRGTGCEVLFLIREEWTKDTIQAELSRRGLKFVFVPYYDTVRHGMPLRVWRNDLKGIIGGSWLLLRLIRKFKATHIHVGNTADVLNFLPALVLTRLPLVFRAGDAPPRRHWLWRMVWRFTRWRAACFVCDSCFMQK